MMGQTLLFLTRGMTAGLTMLTLAAMPVRADFFDDARKTFEADIPHFFQDDIPWAFGGQATSHTKTACKSSVRAAKPAPEKGGAPTTAIPPRDHATPERPR